MRNCFPKCTYYGINFVSYNVISFTHLGYDIYRVVLIFAVIYGLLFIVEDHPVTTSLRRTGKKVMLLSTPSNFLVIVPVSQVTFAAGEEFNLIKKKKILKNIIIEICICIVTSKTPLLALTRRGERVPVSGRRREQI